MARLAACVLVTGLLTCVSCLMEFINPPPFGTVGDMSNSPKYSVGDLVNVVWTPGEEGGAVSLCLYQQNETDGKWFGDMEYLTQNALEITRYNWLVGTRKNLTVSNLFYLSVFQEGKGPSDSNSHYFYIESNQVEEAAPSSSSVSSSTTTKSEASTAAATTTPTGSHTPSAETSAPPASSPTSSATNAPSLSSQEIPSDSFPLGAKIGLGAGIPVALMLGLVAGWLLFRRQRKRNAKAHELPALQPEQYKYYNNSFGGHYGSNMYEAPPRSPVEVGRQTPAHGFSTWEGQPQEKSVGLATPAMVRYEM
ncbi:hypothetical protein ACET3X_006320 [Alternaria dauci]|uniref:Mid2 domain-containing protein n=1 Tax=Alternaria dauci TaxID=48095 RepID=A0ABR3UHY2_9PLEO